jgi:hypothetical protein
LTKTKSFASLAYYKNQEKGTDKMSNLKCVFIHTEQDVDYDDIPFYEKDQPLGKIIQAAIEVVYDDMHCPYFTHIQHKETGFIAITSQPLPDSVLEKLYVVWQERGFDFTLKDPEVILATLDGEPV